MYTLNLIQNHFYVWFYLFDIFMSNFTQENRRSNFWINLWEPLILYVICWRMTNTLNAKSYSVTMMPQTFNLFIIWKLWYHLINLRIWSSRVSNVLHYHTAHKSLCSFPISSVEGEKDIGFYKAMCLVAIDGWIW